MMQFGSIAEFEDPDIRTVYRELTASTLAKALKNAPPGVVDKFFGNMPPDMVVMVKELMENLGDVPGDEVESQRAVILKVIRTLRSEGKIHSHAP